jgi:SNF2 domain-containing protein/C3HC4-type zinc finger (RING finger) protein
LKKYLLQTNSGMQTRSKRVRETNSGNTKSCLPDANCQPLKKINIKKLSGFENFDNTIRDATDDVMASRLCFFYENVHMNVLPEEPDNIQEILRIRCGKPLWISRHYFKLLLHEETQEQLPTDDVDRVLCRFDIDPESDLATLTIYGCYSQHIYLGEPNKYHRLTSGLHVCSSINQNQMETLNQSKTKPRGVANGIDCMSVSTGTTTLPATTTTKLSSLQTNAITTIIKLLEQPYFALIGGLVKDTRIAKNQTTYAFASGFSTSIPNFVYDLLEDQRFAILSTKAGSGKTLMALVYCVYDLLHNPNHQKLRLILVKSHLLPHWVNEIKKHILVKFQKMFLILDSQKDVDRTIMNPKLARNKIILLNFDLLSSFIPILSDGISLLVVDEAHTFSTKSDSALDYLKSIHYHKLLCITATPERQCSSISSLIGLENLLGNHVFGSNVTMASTFFNLNRYNFFKNKAFLVACQIILQNRIIRGVDEELLNIVPHSYRLPSSPRMKQIFDQLCYYRYDKSNIRQLFDLLADIDNLNQTQELLLRRLLSLGAMSSQSVMVACATESNDVCSVCLNMFQSPIQLRVCNHVFCSQCWIQWNIVNKNSRSCPICRTINFEIDSRPNFIDLEKYKDEKKLCSKDLAVGEKNKVVFERISSLLSGEQLLIYTNNAIKANLYESRAQRSGKKALTCGFQKLSSAETRKGIDGFGKKLIDVLILNVNKLADGLNFPNVSNLLIVDFFSSSSLLQATRRIGASRMGSAIRPENTAVQVIMHEKSVQAWLFHQTISQYKHHNKQCLSQIDTSVALLPQINAGKIPSKRHMLELEYFLTQYNQGTRMFHLHEFLKSLVDGNEKNIPHLTFQSGLPKGTRKGKRSKVGEAKYSNYDVQEVSCNWKKHKLSFLFGTHSVSLMTIDKSDVSHLNCKGKKDVKNALK